MTFIDVRDRYGITQLAFNIDSDSSLYDKKQEILVGNTSFQQKE